MKAGDIVRMLNDPTNTDYVNAGLHKGMVGVIVSYPGRRRGCASLIAEVRFFEAPDDIGAGSLGALEVVDA